VETLHDCRVSFALFPPVYLTMFLIRGISILLFNPLFHLLGSQALPLRAVLFATWGGLRGAISLIMAQVVVTDEVLASHGQLVSAQVSQQRSTKACGMRYACCLFVREQAVRLQKLGTRTAETNLRWCAAGGLLTLHMQATFSLRCRLGCGPACSC
jgi:hypothetical protein